jgi:RNA polymerase sigma factor (sigma-70 family)
MQVVRDYTDQDLVAALKDERKTDDAIRFIYRQYYGLLENYVINNSGSADDAADMIQETILAFIEIIHKDVYRGEASVKSFLYTITRNLWLSELRKRSSADTRNKNFETAKDQVEDGMVQHLITREYYQQIQDLFEKLGDKCKQLLMLVYYEDLPMKDIVAQMPDYQNEQVLRNKKYKCMKQLEQLINENKDLKTQFKNALKNAR